MAFNVLLVAFSFLLFLCNGTIATSIYSCCTNPHSFINGSCGDNPARKDSELWPDSISNFGILTNIRRRNDLHRKPKCKFQKLTVGLFKSVDENYINADGYLILKNEQLFLAPNHFCVDSISENNDLVDVIKCGSSYLKTYPKCCPWGHSARCLHPEKCSPQFQNHSILSRSGKSFHKKSINCVEFGKMVSTQEFLISNASARKSLRESLITSSDSFCIDDVITSHESNFSWETSVALFYCDKNWPYEEFGVTDVETFLYGTSLAISAVFLLVAILIYGIRLLKTNCGVHMWIETFYMISLFFLAIFCILQINFPEDHRNFCSFYHIFSVLGYFISGISSFTWATLLSLELFLAFRSFKPPLEIQKETGRFVVYVFFGHAFPIGFSCILFGHNYLKNPAGFCANIEFETAAKTVLLLLLIVNCFCCLSTLKLIVAHWQCAKLATEGTASNRLKQLVNCSVKLYLVCGITFGGIIIGFFTGTVRSSPWYFIIYRLFISFRGVTVFCIFICNKKTKQFLLQFLRKD